MDIEQILRALPHRYPFLLVDRILEVEGTSRVVGLKNVTINEPIFQGHFPGNPIMPGVLIVEAMAQVGGCLMLGAMEQPERKLVYFMGLDGVRFRRPVRPGDQLRMEVTVLQVRGGTVRMKGVATVEGKTVAEGEMLAQIVDREGERGAAR
ncbi:MAG: 3-hydroxyacyl-ACP dehydratase FabZ [Gemmatimonadales bacterium]